MNELQLFNFESHELRTLIVDNEIWFVGNDIARALGYKNPAEAIRTHVDDDDKGKRKISTLGGAQEMVVVNKSGMYALMYSSNLPNAKKFKHWITSEVLPSIEKTGSYSVAAPSYQIEDPIKRAEKWIQEQQEKQVLLLDNKVKDQQIAELQPKASYYDIVLQCKDLVSITKIAKEYGMSGQKMNDLLHEWGIQYKQSDIWLLYQKYAPYGYTQTKTNNYPKEDGSQGARPHMYWTQKGRFFLYETLKSKGIIPLIEREEN